MSRLMYVIPGLFGLVVVTILAFSLVSPDIKSFDGTYNMSQIAIIQSYDKDNQLTYKASGNESFAVTGSINLDSNKIDYLQTIGISVKQTFPTFIIFFAQIFIPIIFAITVILGFARFMFSDDDNVSRTYKHKSDPVINPVYEKIGPIHRNKNYDRVD